MNISVVVPVYNSERTLEELIRRIHAAIGSLGSYEVILVNDGSPDGSWKVIEKLAKEYPTVRGVSLSRNFGQHNALLCGIRQARHDLIVTLDDDLQHPPEEIQKLLRHLGEGHDVVYGVPEFERHSLFRQATSKFTKWAMAKAIGSNTIRNVSAFRAFHRHLISSFADYQNSFISVDVLLSWGTSRFSAVTVAHEERKAGKSNYSIVLLFRHALNMLTGFSVFPLQIASIVGFTFMFIGIVILVYVMASMIISGNPVPGFPFLASMLSIFSGVQLFVLGILGEYLARIHLRSLGKPPYVVSRTVGET